jgi:superfamily II DNA/RNA helicase
VLQAGPRPDPHLHPHQAHRRSKVAEELAERGFAAAAIHGDLGQGAREQALRAFRNGKVDVLVATDVAARGIDVENVTHVVNYQCPEDEKTYVHRIGRTGRAGNTGIAITLVDWEDMPRWSLIDRQLDLGIPEPVETYSSSEHLYTELDIPTDARATSTRPSRPAPASTPRSGRDRRSKTVARRDRPSARERCHRRVDRGHDDRQRTPSLGRCRGHHTGRYAVVRLPVAAAPSAPSRRQLVRRRSSGHRDAGLTRQGPTTP